MNLSICMSSSIEIVCHIEILVESSVQLYYKNKQSYDDVNCKQLPFPMTKMNDQNNSLILMIVFMIIIIK
jgi:hypothetical protein